MSVVKFDGGTMFSQSVTRYITVYGSGLGKKASASASCVERRQCCSCRGAMSSGSCLQRFSETVTHMMIAYAVPLFLLTLYYNYGYEYGVTGLHLVYPLCAVLPYLLNGQRSRELTDACQVASGMSAALLTTRHGNYYVLGAHLAQGSVYYFNQIRGLQYRLYSSQNVYNGAMLACIYLMYVGLLQSCVDSHGRVDCEREYRRLESCYDLYEEDDSL